MANLKIKGITIEIGGNTTKLGNALDSVNKKTTSLQTELKSVNALLKMDPSNINLIKQKQDILNESIENTKEKLNVLKGTQEQVQSEFQKGKITIDQYRDFQREITNTENKLKSLTESAKSFGSNTSSHLLSAKVKLDNFSVSAVNAGKKLSLITAGMVTGAVVVGKTAVNSMNEVDEGLDTVMKKTGATGETAKNLQSIYEEVARTVPGAFGDIGAAVGEINTRLDFTGDKLKNASVSFLQFAKVNDMDVNTSVQLVTRAMGDASIGADEYQGLLDMLTVASQKSGISIDTLSTNLAKYGAPMRALGIDTQQAIAMFAGWEKAGVSTEIAFSGMKKAISNWGAAGKDSTVEFQKALDQIKKCPSIADATTKSIEIFGAKAGPDLADAIRGGRFEFEAYTEALKNSGGTVKNTYGMIVDEVDDAELANQNFKIALHSLGDTISKTIGPILLELSKKFQNLLNKFNGLNGTTKNIILGVIGVIAIVGPLLILIGKMASGISAIVKVITLLKNSTILATVAIKVMAVAQGVLNAVMSLNPIGLIILAITALIAIFVVLWNKCDWFRKGWQLAFDGIVDVCKKAIDWCISFIKGIIDFIANNWQGLLLVLANPFAGAFKLIYDNCEGFRNIVDQTVQSIQNFFSNLWFNIQSIFSSVGSFFGNIFLSAYANIVLIFSNIIGFFSGIWQKIVSIFTTIGSSIGNAVGSAFNNVVNSIISFAEGAINGFIRSINMAIKLINKIPGVNIGKMQELSLSRFRTGGTMLGDGDAIMAEAGSPELLSMRNGKAYIRPLTNRDRSQVINNQSTGDTYNSTINVNSKYVGPGETARQSRRELQLLRLRRS